MNEKEEKLSIKCVDGSRLWLLDFSIYHTYCLTTHSKFPKLNDIPYGRAYFMLPYRIGDAEPSSNF